MEETRERRDVDKSLYRWITTALASLSVVAIVSSYGLVREMAESRKINEFQTLQIDKLYAKGEERDKTLNQILLPMTGRVESQLNTMIKMQEDGNKELRLLRDWQKANEGTVKEAGEYIRNNWNK